MLIPLIFHFAITSVSSCRLYSPLSLVLITVFPTSAPSLSHPPQTAVSGHELSSFLLVFFHGSYSLLPPQSDSSCLLWRSASHFHREKVFLLPDPMVLTMESFAEDL